MTTEPAELPHALKLSLTGDYDPDEPGWWDAAELICPHNPPTELMPCAVFVPCGCTPVSYEFDNWYHRYVGDDEIDPLIDPGALGPCPQSATGAHHYAEGEPNRPAAECWPKLHVEDLDEAATELGLPPDVYAVWPRNNGDGGLELLCDPTEAAEAWRRIGVNQ